MTEASKTTLFYILALAGLIVSSILFTGRIEPLTEAQAAPTTPTFTKAGAAQTLPETERRACPTTQKVAYYRVDTSKLVDHRLVISGTIYASDFKTPLPDVLIEFWQTHERQPDFPTTLPDTPYYVFPASYSKTPPYVLPAWARTDVAGHYKTTILKPGQGNTLLFYYRVRYQNRCLLGQQLLVVDEAGLTDSALTSTLAKLGLAKGSPAGPLLRGPVDIVLPATLPPLNVPSAETSELASGAPPTKGMTWGPAEDALFETE